MYKNKYNIGVYDDDETLVGLFENTVSFAKFFNMPFDKATQKLYKIFKKIHSNNMVIGNKTYTVEFIDVLED